MLLNLDYKMALVHCYINQTVRLLDFLLLHNINVITYVYIGYPVAIIGLISSVVALILLKKDKEIVNSTQLILFCINAMNIQILSCIIFMGMYLLLKLKVFTAWHILHCLFRFSNLIRNWLLSLLAVERYLLLNDPHNYPKRWSIARVQVLLSLFFVTALMFQLPDIFYLNERLSNGDLENLRLLRALQGYINITLISLLPLLCILVMCCLTSKTIRVITHRYVLREELHYSPQSVDKKNQCIFKIITSFLVRFAISLIPALGEEVIFLHIVVHCKSDDNALIALTFISALDSLSSVVNSACDFFIYIFYNIKYRRVTCDMLVPKFLTTVFKK